MSTPGRVPGGAGARIEGYNLRHGSSVLGTVTFKETAMRHALMCGAVLVVLAFRAAEQDRPIPLFNGKDLSGWMPVLDEAGPDPARTWRVADGVPRCTGRPAGYIKTDREFADYVLRLEWRWPPGTAGGKNGGARARLDAAGAGDLAEVHRGAALQGERGRPLGHRHRSRRARRGDPQ